MAERGVVGSVPLPPNLGQEPLEAPGAGGGQMEPLMRLIYQVDQALDAIARQFPGVAAEIDRVKTSLEGVVATASQSGAAPQRQRGLSTMAKDMRGAV